MRLTAAKIVLFFCPMLAFGAAFQLSDRWPTPDTLDELYESGDPDRLVAGGVLAAVGAGKTQYAAEDFFITALEENPSHTLAAHSLLAYCARTAATQICKDDGYLRSVAANDETNGAVWEAYAALKHKHGGSDAALPFLRRAADTPVYDGYFVSYLALFNDLLREQADVSPKDHVLLVMALAAQATTVVRMFGMCQTEKSAAWTEACLRLGQSIEEVSSGPSMAIIGQKFQISMLARGEDSQGVRAVKERREKLRDSLSSPDPSLYFGDDDGFWYDMVDTFVRQGELASVRLIHERVRGVTPIDRWSNKEPVDEPAVQVTEGLTLAAVVQAATAEFIITENRVPENRKEAGLPPDPRYNRGRYVESIDVVSGTIVITYGHDADPRLKGLTVGIKPYLTKEMSLVWQCGYSPAPLGLVAIGGSNQVPSTVPPDFMPAVCLP